MLSMPWSTAPTAFAGLGVAVRPYADCAAARPDLGGVAGPVRGTGVPSVGAVPSGSALRHRGTGLPTAALAEGIASAQRTQQNFDLIPQNDGTTLGFHPSGRPLS
jgi:hypothetical protein